MKQCIVRLPEYADISVGEWDLLIESHKVVTYPKLFAWIMAVIKCDAGQMR